MGATEALAAFAIGMDASSLSPEVVHAARRAILDCIGVALAGSVEPAGQIIAAQAQAQGGIPECVIWGTGGRVSAQNAALANGTAAHALDYDDTNHSMLGHPSVPVLPAVLAIGERLGASGTEVLAAFVAGFEVECKLGRFTGQDPFDRGWHCTTTLGVIGATAGVGRLAGLDVAALRRAIGLAVAQASGVRQNFGTMTKPFHVGRAAQSAILAVELVQRGFTASETAIEGEFGYWEMFGGDRERDGKGLASALGHPFDLEKPGVNFKAYPCCASTHPAIDAALSAGGGLPVEAIDRVVVDVPYTAPLVLIHHRPVAPLAAKFSLEYCVAAALLDGDVGLAQFTEAMVNRPEVQSLLRRVEYRVPDAWQKGAGPWRHTHARVEVRLRDGTVRTGETTVPRGDGAKPMSDAELEAKFLTCAGRALGGDQARRALDLVRQFERLDRVRRMADALVGPALIAQRQG
jgi:2-methylcitrate dehydratase PrpD